MVFLWIKGNSRQSINTSYTSIHDFLVDEIAKSQVNGLFLPLIEEMLGNLRENFWICAPVVRNLRTLILRPAFLTC
jgi:hypothetical protein